MGISLFVRVVGFFLFFWWWWGGKKEGRKKKGKRKGGESMVDGLDGMGGVCGCLDGIGGLIAISTRGICSDKGREANGDRAGSNSSASTAT